MKDSARERQPRAPKFRGRFFYVVCNWGNPWKVFPRRRDALEFARQQAADNQYTRQTWQQLFEIHKVSLEVQR